MNRNAAVYANIPVCLLLQTENKLNLIAQKFNELVAEPTLLSMYPCSKIDGECTWSHWQLRLLCGATATLAFEVTRVPNVVTGISLFLWVYIGHLIWLFLTQNSFYTQQQLFSLLFIIRCARTGLALYMTFHSDTATQLFTIFV